jgi:stringent starvation protein B
VKIGSNKFGRRAAALGLTALIAVGTAGCGAINQQATAMTYAASDGIVANVGDLKVRNLMLVANDADSEARFLGSIVNDTDQAQTLTVTLDSGNTTFEVEPKTSLKLEDSANEKTVSKAGKTPGEQVDATLEADGTTSNVAIPVVDGALEEYREYIPGGFDEKTVEHLEHTEKAEEGH